MSQYIALYRKFRPSIFNDVVGQEHIIKVLKHQINNNQIGHAYLFCGSRGTGKTTTAKIFSRAVNCVSPVNGEPCNECAICKGILDNSVTDVLEIDAASNNSVEDIRAIRENVIYAPTLAKYKVYIIDEVHMLSTSAFNALLKTLEEPPQNIIFILATTEPHKIPITILSRCQRFEFKRILKEDISKRLEYVCNENNITYEDKALLVIAQAAEGALRDALSLLDQIISAGVTNITEEVARDILGIAKQSVTSGILNAIIDNDINSVLSIVSSVVDSGKDIKYFVWEIISLARDVLVYKTTNDENIVNNFAMLENIKELEKKSDIQKLSNIITYLSEVESSIKGATFPSILLESSLITFISGGSTVNKNYAPNNITIAKPKEEVLKKQENNVVLPKAENKEVPKTNSLSGDWKDIINHLKASGKMPLYATLVSTKASIENDKITVYFAQEFGKNVLEKAENMQALKNSALAILGREVSIKCALINSSKPDANDVENNLINSGIDVNIL